MNWVKFVALGALAYVGIAVMGQWGTALAAKNIWEVLHNAYQPRVVALMLVANGLWIVAVHYGRLESKTATSMIVAMGVVIIFAYYAIMLSAPVTMLKVLGVALVLLGIYCLA